jgi:hypothetical protein
MADEEILYGIPKISPQTFNSYCSQFFTTYLSGLTQAELLALLAVAIPFKTNSGDIKATRSLNTEYTNTSHLPILVQVTFDNPSGFSYGVYFECPTGQAGASRQLAPSAHESVEMIIPSGSTFKVQRDNAVCTVFSWVELT